MRSGEHVLWDAHLRALPVKAFVASMTGFVERLLGVYAPFVDACRKADASMREVIRLTE